MPLHDSEEDIIDQTKLAAFKRRREKTEHPTRPSNTAIGGALLLFVLFLVMILAPLAELVWLDRHFPVLRPILETTGAFRGWFMERF